MKIKNKKDFGLGIFCILFAVFVTSMSMQLKATGYDGDPGPKMFPMIGAVIVAVCGIALIVAPGKPAGAFLTKSQWKSAGLMFGAYVLLILLLYLVGFIGAVPVMLFAITFMLSKLSAKDYSVKKRLIVSAVFGLVGGAVLYLAYVVGLDAKMPAGLVWSLLK